MKRLVPACGHDFVPVLRLGKPTKECAACREDRLEAMRMKTRAKHLAIANQYRAGSSVEQLAERYGFKPSYIVTILKECGAMGRQASKDPLFASRAIRKAAEVAGANVEQLKSDWRYPKSLVRARWAFMVAAHEKGLPKAEIGRRLCRDHTTVMYGIRQAQIFVERSPEFRDMLEQVRAA